MEGSLQASTRAISPHIPFFANSLIPHAPSPFDCFPLLRGEKTLARTRRFLENLRIFSLAESLGGVESLVEHPGLMTHASIPEHIRREIGITDSLVRFSVGLENVDDLIEDLEEGFQKMA
ncbi:MAG: PLP-dependent transferase [bacterium]